MILALISRKGGVGKTTTAVSLAAGIAARGRRVLLVDLDSQGSASLSLGLRRAEFPPSAADVLLGRRAIDETIRATALPRLDILTSSADLATFDHAVAHLKEHQRLLQVRLAAIRPNYDFIFIDCPPSLTLLTVNALVAADAFIVPAIPHYLALEGLHNLISSARRVGYANAARTRLLGVLLTMVDYRARLMRENVNRIRREYDRQVFAIEIRVNVRLAEAPEFGRTIFEHDCDSTGAKAYGLAAEEVLLRCGFPSPQELRHKEPRPRDSFDYATSPALPAG